MNIRTACYLIGDGDRARGCALVCALARRLRTSRRRRPVLGGDMLDLAEALWRGVDETDLAARGAGEERFADEALDVAATAMRAVNGEWR